MDYEELRPIVLESLKKNNETQIINVLNDVEKLSLKKGFYKDAQIWRMGGQITEHRMPKEDREKVREIINDLIVERIIGWGINELNPGPPFLKVTKYGKECINKEGPQPYDPDGYLRYLKTEINNIDDIILLYMTESLQAYLKGLMFSSTIMLGCASEKAIILLSEAYLNSLNDQNKKLILEKKFNTQIKKRMDSLRKELIILKSQQKLPKEYINDFEIQIDGIFNFIRTCRNDAGHPTGKVMDRRIVYANLRIFVPFCIRVYDLIDFFSNNTI